jgi:hypothetical protein
MKEVSCTGSFCCDLILCFLLVGQYLGGDKYQVQAERDVHAKQRRTSYGNLAPPAVSLFVLIEFLV